MEFHFIRPLWFIAVIPVIFVLWLLSKQRTRNNGWLQIIPAHLVNYLIQGDSVRKHQPFGLLTLVWLVIVSALAGPTWEKLPQPVYQTNIGKVVVMDMSMSMRATDIKPNRLTKARYKAIDLIEKIDDADVGLIAYAGDAFVISPLTADSKNLTALIPNLSPEIMPVEGSDPYLALKTADELLKNAGYNQGEIYLITDGIDYSQIQELQTLITSTNHRLSILGVGTLEGAPVKQVNGELLKDAKGSIVIPKLNDGQLRQLAHSTGGVYARLTNNDVDIERLSQQNQLSNEAKKDTNQQHQGDQWKEFGPYLVLLILPFAAYAFRRGLVVCAVVSLSLLHSQPVRADWWQDLWQTKDQQALQQFSQQDYENAAQTFNDPKWRGSSLYKSGDYEGALAEFKKTTDANSYYNQGNALAQLQNIDEAIKAYEQALTLDPEMADAQKNLDILKQLKDQQQQSDQNQQQDQDKDKEQGEQQDQQQDQQKQQESGQNQDQESQSDQQSDQQSNDQQQPEPREEDQSQQSKSEQNKDAQNDPKAQEKQQSEEDQQSEQQTEQEKAEQAKQQAMKDGEEADDGEEKTRQQQAIPEPELTTEEQEQMQEIQQLMRRIPDDPSILLRNKMRLEYQKHKQQQNNQPPGAKKSW